MRYCMEYLKTANVNLIKDMGMIPYKLYKLYGYDSKVATYSYGEYPYLENEVKGLKIDFINRKFKSLSLDGVSYLRKNAKDIDVLQIFHCTLSSVAYANTYKFYNPKGKIYLKLDCSHKLVERIMQLGAVELKILNLFLNKIDLISVEQEELYHKLKKLLKQQEHKFINIPNGIDYDYINSLGLTYDFSEKENIILSVARIGAEEKNVPMLLEAFAKITNIDKSGWKLHLVGAIEEGFNLYIEDYYQRYPHLKDIVIFKGEITDRKTLYDEYRKAKIFSLTSEFESFGIAFIEAAAFGDVVVSTDVGIAKEIVQGENGELVATKDTEGLSKALEKAIFNSNLESISQKTYDICKEKFDWNKIVANLHEHINSL
ncbi:MAG: glycosyltransferase family 4 protein [Bacillota bacterium]|nr:glycosyltransferase family 4 protein [Bacillota bacterium]